MPGISSWILWAPGRTTATTRLQWAQGDLEVFIKLNFAFNQTGLWGQSSKAQGDTKGILHPEFWSGKEFRGGLMPKARLCLGSL